MEKAFFGALLKILWSLLLFGPTKGIVLSGTRIRYDIVLLRHILMDGSGINILVLRRACGVLWVRTSPKAKVTRVDVHPLDLGPGPFFCLMRSQTSQG